MDDIERELVQAGKVRREQLKSTFEHGADLGQWVGKGVGFASAFAILSAYYALVWVFTGSFILGKRVAHFRRNRALPEGAPRRIPARIRAEVARRQDWLCKYGGQPLPSNGFRVSHVVARIDGGTDDPSNLVACCVRHHKMMSVVRDFDFRTDMLSDPAIEECGKKWESGSKPKTSDDVDIDQESGGDERVPGNDWEDFMRDASLIRRERVQHAIQRGGRVGTVSGKGVGVALAFAVLALYYATIWTFNVVYAIGKWLPKRMRTEEQNAYRDRQMQEVAYLARVDPNLWYCAYGGGALRLGEREVSKDGRRLLFGLDHDIFTVVSCGFHARARGDFHGGDFDDFRRYLKQNRDFLLCGPWPR